MKRIKRQVTVDKKFGQVAGWQEAAVRVEARVEGNNQDGWEQIG
jgi:hypothetical protein